jgi:hypothetical protein
MDANNLLLEAKSSAASLRRRVLAAGRTAYSAVLVRTMSARELVRGGWSIFRAWFFRQPRALRYGAACAAVVAVAFVCYETRTDPVERAVLRGDLRTARKELRAVHGPSRAYDAGRIQEAQKAYGPAAASYVAAERNGDSRGLERLIEMSRSRRCRARIAAANGLGELGDDRSVRALNALAKRKYPDEHGRSCSTRRAARAALERVRGRG